MLDWSHKAIFVLFYYGEKTVKRKIYKVIYIALILSITVSLLGMSQPALASAGTFRTTADVNIRAEPSTDAAVVTVVYNSTNVEVLDHNPAGWSRVQVGGHTGFIRSDFLRFPISNSSASFRTTSGVNLRSSASTDSNILSTVVAGTSVEVLEHNPAGWSRVRVSGTGGFIRSDFLTRGGNGSAWSGAAASTSSASVSVGTLRTTAVVNVRAGPSTDTSVITTLARGTSVEVIENQSNGWSSIKHNSTSGFIRSDLLTSGTGSQAAPSTLRTTSVVNIRSGPSTEHRVIRTIAAGTSVEVLNQQADGWSSIRHNGTDGFIRTDLLSSAGATSSAPAIATLRTTTGVNFRTGPSTNDSVIRLLAVNTSVDVLENLSNGWSKVRHSGTVGYIRSDLLGTGARTVELIDWSTARSIVPTGVNLRVVDVRTGISFQLRGFSKTGHIDVETPTQADTDALLRTRNGVWAWTPRPVWVTVGERTFAAALNGMPHSVSTIRDNGMNGHLCLHFNNTVTNSKSYQSNLNSAVMEAFNARPQ